METSVLHEILEGFDYIGGTDYLIRSIEGVNGPILGGAAIILLVRLFDKGFALSWKNLMVSTKEVKWELVALFLLTLIPKLTKVIVMCFY